MVGAGILATLLHQLGTGPFVEAVNGVSIMAICAALVITAGTTWCCARRWSLISERLGMNLPMPAAFRACYRAQLLNATLPTGVVGDLDRAVWHGHSHQAVSRGLRSVFWERASGQVVLFALALGTIPVLAPPVRSWMLWGLAGAAVVMVTTRFVSPGSFRMVWAEARSVPGAPGVLSHVVLLSTLAVVGHVAVFLIAARGVGVTAPTLTLVPLGLALLLVSAVPLSIAGWGPREGGAALIFGAAGLGASTGLVVSVAYGVLAMLATLPGIVALRRRRMADAADEPRGGAPWVNVPTPS